MARTAARTTGSASKRVPGDVQVVADEPLRVELVRLELGRDAAVGEHRALTRWLDERRRSRRCPRLDRAAQLDARGLELLRGEPPLRRPRRACRRQRARPPSAATHAATFAACPPGRQRRRARARPRPRASSPSSRTITSSTRSPRETTSIAYDRRMASDAEPRDAFAQGAHALVRARRRRRRLGGRGRDPSRDAGAAAAPCRRGSARSRARRATASCSSGSAGTARSRGARAPRARPSGC